MESGTDRTGLIVPGRTRPSIGFWHRFCLRPLPHQHRSFDRSDVRVVITPQATTLRARRGSEAAVAWTEPDRTSMVLGLVSLSGCGTLGRRSCRRTAGSEAEAEVVVVDRAV